MSLGDARPWLAILALVAVLVRAAIPAGWMPDLSEASGPHLVICTGHGAMSGERPDAPAAPHKSDHHDVCAFSTAAAGPAPAAVDIAETPGVSRLAEPWAEAVASAPLRPLHREQSARAPPQRA